MIQITPEPAAKRTVEGDLGVYVNAGSLARQIGMAQLSRELGMDVTALFEHYRPIPDTPEQFRLTELLSWYAASMALERHCGKLRHTYGANGRVTYADGKDLTKIKYLVATGGALTRLPGRQAIMERLRRINGSGKLLYPKADKISLLEDRWYCMASLGVLSRTFPEAAVCLLRQNLSLR